MGIWSCLSNGLNAVPIVGAGKALIHYAVGDTEEGHRALYESTRSTLVMAAGAAGTVAGPVGAAACAAYAGILTDTVVSVASDSPKGVMKGVVNIGNDIKEGRSPVGSAIETTVMVGMDSVCGLGMGGVASAASNISEKAVVKTVETASKKIVGEKMAVKISEEAVKIAIKEAVVVSQTAMVTGHVCYHAKKEVKKSVAEEERAEKQEKQEKWRQKEKEKERKRTEEKEKETKNQTSSGSGSDPPKDNNKKDNNCKQQKESKLWNELMEIIKSLLIDLDEDVIKKIKDIFQNLEEKHKPYLEQKIRKLKKNRCLKEVQKIVLGILINHFPECINYENYLSFLEIAQKEILDQVNRQNVANLDTQTYPPPTSYEDELKKLISDIANNVQTVPNIVSRYLEVQNNIEIELEAESELPYDVSPDFRDIVAAVSHYIKHFEIPGDGTMTAEEYYRWRRDLLNQVKELPEFEELANPNHNRIILIYEVYVSKVDRRITIVLKNQEGDLILSSVYFRDHPVEGDSEGDIFIGGKPKKKKE